MRVQSFIVVIFMAVISSCTRTEWVASVGNQRISKQDVELRQEMISLMNPDITVQEALDQLIKYKLGTSILEGDGQKISQQEVAAELKKIKYDTTRFPSLESLVKKYQKNPSYSELFLFPRIVDKKLKDLYENDKAFHEKEYLAASALLARARTEPQNLEILASEKGASFFLGKLSEDNKTIIWNERRGLASSTTKPPTETWFLEMLQNEMLKNTETGKVFGEIKPMWFGYLILRKDPSEKSAPAFSLAVAPRKPQWQWLKEKGLLIPVTRFDGAP